MKKRITTLLALLALAFTPVVVPSVVSAACNTAGNSAKSQVLEGVGTVGGDCTGQGVNNIFTTTVNILSYLVGAVAVIMILVGGFKYITSSGDSGKVASAKSTLIYAIIGLVVAVSAQLLVNLTVGQSESIKPCQYDASITAGDPKCKQP